MLPLFIFYISFFKEKGIIKEWDVKYRNDTVFIIYTVDYNLNKTAEKLFLLKFNLDLSYIKKEKIIDEFEGIFSPKIELSDSITLYFQKNAGLIKELKLPQLLIRLNIKNREENVIFKSKKLGSFSVNKKNNVIVFNSRNKIFMFKNNSIKEIALGINPIISNSSIYFLRGIPGKPNVVFKIDLETNKEEIIWDKEIVLIMEKIYRTNFLLLTEGDTDPMGDHVYLLKDKKEVLIWKDEGKNIIIPPSTFVKDKTVYVLISASNDFVPDEIYLLKYNLKNNNLSKVLILKEKNIEAKWIKYPYFIILKKFKDYSAFIITSVL